MILLILGLILRLFFLFQMNETGLQIEDELHYFTLASSIFEGWGFAWGPDDPTSIRPPFYPAFAALIWWLIGEKSVFAVQITQIGVSLLNVALLYFLGRRIFSHRVAILAAAMFCFYPSMVAFNFFFLTEVLFAFWLTLLAFGVVVLFQTEKISVAIGTGVTLGLAALTRSILWPFPLLLCPFLFLTLRGDRGTRVKLVGCLLMGYLIMVAPWAVRNTELQGVLTIITSQGGITLLMGNYEHTPLNRAWDPDSAIGEQSIFEQLREEYPEAENWTEGRKEKWANKTALEFIMEHPQLTVQRSIIKFASFWGLERTIIAGFHREFYHPPPWFAALITCVVPLAYGVVMILACWGIFLALPDDKRVHWLILLIIFFISGLHSMVFGHSRYHLPLMPFVILYAASAFIHRSWDKLRDGFLCAAGPVLAFTGLLLSWGREVFLVEADRVQTLIALLFG